MKSLANRRSKMGVSQRNMADLSGLSFRTIQLIESGGHDPKISTLSNIADALGYPPSAIDNCIENIFTQPVDSISIISERILTEGEESWKIWLFNFVDAFRNKKDRAYIYSPPVCGLSSNLNALVAGTVETLCDELGIKTPLWCDAVPPLTIPWFVSGFESLKALAIVESPIHFRKRNIFVLDNFLFRR